MDQKSLNKDISYVTYIYEMLTAKKQSQFWMCNSVYIGHGHLCLCD